MQDLGDAAHAGATNAHEVDVFDGVLHEATLTPALSRGEREELPAALSPALSRGEGGEPPATFRQGALTPALSHREREPLNRNAAGNFPLSLWERG